MFFWIVPMLQIRMKKKMFMGIICQLQMDKPQKELPTNLRNCFTSWGNFTTTNIKPRISNTSSICFQLQFVIENDKPMWKKNYN